MQIIKKGSLWAREETFTCPVCTARFKIPQDFSRRIEYEQCTWMRRIYAYTVCPECGHQKAVTKERKF